MRDRSLTVATYAAGASLAAVAFWYVFAPSGSSTYRPSPSKKIGPVGLANPANDCFINSVLQALAGLGELRLYLVSELHQRALYRNASIHARPPDLAACRQLEGLQAAIVTQGLEDMLNLLNERHIHKKKIVSAAPFVKTLELAFHQRISRQQQDAQEFLQIIVERLRDEYLSGCKTHGRGTSTVGFPSTRHTEVLPDDRQLRDEPVVITAGSAAEPGSGDDGAAKGVTPNTHQVSDPDEAMADADASSSPSHRAFPMEGRYQSQIQCLTCGFKPRPTESIFCTLTLNVPQVSSTTLNACLDGMFKTEYIDGFKCEKCRLLHAATTMEGELRKYTGARDSVRADEAALALAQLRHAITTNPENPPANLRLPHMQFAPKRHISRHVRLTQLPRILAIHLSRSIFSANLSLKNSAKVAFAEELKLGSLLHQQSYRLVCVVTHWGSHSSGHFECFRRQSFSPPFPNIDPSQASGDSHMGTRLASTPWINEMGRASRGVKKASTPSFTQHMPTQPVLTTGKPSQHFTYGEPSGGGPAPEILSPVPRTAASTVSALQEGDVHGRQSLRSRADPARLRTPTVASWSTSQAASQLNTSKSSDYTLSTENSNSEMDAQDRAKVSVLEHQERTKRKKENNVWWRISDDKIKESSVKEVLGLQSEAFLLFYELQRI